MLELRTLIEAIGALRAIEKDRWSSILREIRRMSDAELEKEQGNG